MDKKALSETDIRTKFITPAIVGEGTANWDLMSQVREEVYFTNEPVIVDRAKVCKEEKSKLINWWPLSTGWKSNSNNPAPPPKTS